MNTDQNKIPAWLNYHPHIVNARLSNYRKNNTIYIAQERLALSGLAKAGAGAFPHFMDKLRLTAPWESSRSHWLLPKWFFPFKEPSRPPLTYHKNPKRWTLNDDGVLLSTAYRGQEFVLDTEYYPEAMDWLKSLFESVN